MPGFDGKGPNGQGPLTGRGLGPCGRGLARGMGRGFRCRFRTVPVIQEPISEAEEKKLLEQEKQEIEKRLKELKK